MATALWRTFETVAETRCDHVALIQGERHVTFGELRASATAIAAEFVRRGLQPGDRCLISGPNTPELAAAMLAVWLLGAIVALVNDEAPASHLRHAAEVTDAALVMTDAAYTDSAASALDRPAMILPHAGDGPLEPRPRPAGHDHEPASIFFTSGSTGPPKGVVQSHANLAAGCRMVAGHLGLRPDDRILCPIPWSFDYGYGQLLSTLLLGVAQVLPEARTPFAVCEAIERHRPTVFAGLPSIFALLTRGISPLRRTDVSSLRLLTNTGAAIAPDIFEDVLRIFGHCEISLNYGLTETYRSAGLPVGLARRRPQSVGFAYPGVNLAVMRETGEEAEPGELGEIVHRGVGVFLGYWGAPEATAKVLRPDPLWRCPGAPAPPAVFTGDLGWKDADGFLMIKGRRDRLIKSMGVRVSPDEIEAMVRGTGLVRDVAVVGLAHAVMGELVAAAVTVAEGAPDPVPALRAFARRTMSRYMEPRVYRVMDGFPLTPNGKTDFGALRQFLAQDAPADLKGASPGRSVEPARTERGGGAIAAAAPLGRPVS